MRKPPLCWGRTAHLAGRSLDQVQRMSAASAAVLAELHSAALRSVTAVVGERFQGLRSAAGVLRRRGLITNRLAKQLCHIDDAYALVRHIDLVRQDMVLDELDFLLHLASFAQRFAWA